MSLNPDLLRLRAWLDKRLAESRAAGHHARVNFKTAAVNGALFSDHGQEDDGRSPSPGALLLEEAEQLGWIRRGSRRATWVDMRHLSNSTSTWDWRQRQRA